MFEKDACRGLWKADLRPTPAMQVLNDIMSHLVLIVKGSNLQMTTGVLATQKHLRCEIQLLSEGIRASVQNVREDLARPVRLSPIPMKAK